MSHSQGSGIRAGTLVLWYDEEASKNQLGVVLYTARWSMTGYTLVKVKQLDGAVVWIREDQCHRVSKGK